MTTAQAFMELAYAAEDKHNWREAVKYYTEAIQLDPTIAEAYYSRAMLNEEKAPWAEVKADLDEAIRLAPSNYEYHFSRAEMFRCGDPATTVLDLTFCLQTKPDDIKLLEMRADVYECMHDEPSAIADLLHGLELEPSNVTFHRKLAEAYEKQGNLDAAIETYQKMLLLSKTAWYFERIARIYVKKNDLTTAIASWSSYIQLAPKSDEGYGERMKLYQTLGDQASYEHDLMLYDLYHYDGSRTYITRGNGSLAVSNFECALFYFGEAIRRYPKSPEAFYGRGRTQQLRNNIEAALSDYAVALALNDQYGEVYLDRAILHAQLEQYANAIADFEKVLMLQPDARLEHDIRDVLAAWKQQS